MNGGGTGPRLESSLSQERFNALVRPRLLFFASVDLENSTQLKQTPASRHEQAWLRVVTDFVASFPEFYERKVEECARRLRIRKYDLPTIWKILGDEIIFELEVCSLPQVRLYFLGLHAALEEWNDKVRRDRRQAGAVRCLLAKGTAWTAGFPVCNTVFPVGEQHLDFIGPSMDGGFRLCRLATPRRLALSVDLVWLLLAGDLKPAVDIRFQGGAALKGMAEESGYPQLWADVNPSSYQAQEAVVLGRKPQRLSAKQLRRICADFIEEFGVPDHPPFIPGDKTLPKPSGYDEAQKRTSDVLLTIYSVSGDPKAPADVASTLLPAALKADLAAALQQVRDEVRKTSDQLGRVLAASRVGAARGASPAARRKAGPANPAAG